MQAEKLSTSWWGRMDRDIGGPLPSLASLTDTLGCVLTPQGDRPTFPYFSAEGSACSHPSSCTNLLREHA